MQDVPPQRFGEAAGHERPEPPGATETFAALATGTGQMVVVLHLFPPKPHHFFLHCVVVLQPFPEVSDCVQVVRKPKKPLEQAAATIRSVSGLVSRAPMTAILMSTAPEQMTARTERLSGESLLMVELLILPQRDCLYDVTLQNIPGIFYELVYCS